MVGTETVSREVADDGTGRGMKVRIGFGVGTRSGLTDPADLGRVADGLERRGFDSLWFAERLTGPLLDPMVAMSFVAGRTDTLKFGPAVMVLPGRNPVEVAKTLASLDRISNGRLLPAVGLGAVNPMEHQAFGVTREERSARFDEALPLIRELWTGEPVTHHGAHFRLDGVRVRPTPVQDPLEVWMGGISPSELRRTARLGDGWLPSFCTPDDVEAGIATIRTTAADHDREIDPEHFGALIVYGDATLPDEIREGLAARRPGVDPVDLLATSHDEVRTLIERFVAVGASKFVVMPLFDPPDWDDELGRLADVVLPLQS
jgi:probable F420-dependent oxidoreductase